MTDERIELLDTAPVVAVAEAEYRRLLGYPRGHVPTERSAELEAWARRWYAEHGQPWVYWREVEVELDNGTLRFDGAEFASVRLHEHLRQAGVQRAMVVAVSAGRACEQQARALWEEGRPDEYFFLEVFGSAVVEHLVASLNGRICDAAAQAGLAAIPHYSPGYAGWEVVDQNRLHELIAKGATQPWPEALEVLASGMLKPKKSLLAVVGLAPRESAAVRAVPGVPCTACAYSPCQYRRSPYRHAPARIDGVPKPPPLSREARYTVSDRALRKWAEERVTLQRRGDGTVGARFRFDGTTCSNMGQPLAFEYVLELDTPERAYTVLEADCRPADGDEGYQSMCAYLSDSDGWSRELAMERPAIGRPLDEVFAARRNAAPSGCLCTAENRAHKWTLALEAIHYALAHANGAAHPQSLPNPP